MILAKESTNPADVIKWGLVLVVLVIGGFMLVAWMRRRLTGRDETPQSGFTLSDLRELHRSGKISTEEFEKARDRMVASMKAAEARKQK